MTSKAASNSASIAFFSLQASTRKAESSSLLAPSSTSKDTHSSVRRLVSSSTFRHASSKAAKACCVTSNSDSTCHAWIPSPTRMADPNRVRGARLYTGTLFLLFQTLVGPSLITESKYHIQKYNIKLPPWWCLHCQYIHTVLSPIYLYIYKKKLYISITYSERITYCDEPLLVCWPSCMQKIADVLLCTYTD